VVVIAWGNAVEGEEVVGVVEGGDGVGVASRGKKAEWWDRFW